jgi:GTPase SAR1 family protein
VIFVGNASAGKTSLISRLKWGSTYYDGEIHAFNDADET